MPTTTDVIKTVLLEDEDLLRGLLSEWLSAQPDIELLDSFRSIKAFNAGSNTSVSRANVIIADIVLPDGDGLEASFKALELNNSSQGLVVISGRPTSDLFDRLSSRLNGSWAFLLKNSNGLANLRQAISAVQSGLVMVDPNLKTMFTRAGQNLSLTDQERSVMERVAEGMSNAVIAGEIFASEKTVERVLSSIYSKYGLVGTSKIENPRVRATLIFRGLAK
jgi:DNA-binding NarL/FixJ family response regulator